MPNVPLGRRLATFVRAGLFYAWWYPSRWLGWGAWPKYGEFGELATHMRWVERTSRRLARAQFHLMVLNGPALERRQAQLFRCVDIGAELFAVAATCVRARRDVQQGVADLNAIELAGVFARSARRRVDGLFRALASNDDAGIYEVARDVLEDRYAWLETGIVPAETEAPAATPLQGAAAGK